MYTSSSPLRRAQERDRRIGRYTSAHLGYTTTGAPPMCCRCENQFLMGFSSSHFYYDSTWNSIIANEQYEDSTESQLSGYLQWLDEKVDGEDSDQSTEKGYQSASRPVHCKLP
ncbi:hypothetical protein OIU77_017931 [Salix suchowensis]|uniref:Uncharacterized protein n=1 Tax=Salix suchowensis TaxID=1278906 RepID=A0ABQ8ZQQ1_9ROSI|nr:hypothetical protein OIU77_017931 [Salix suchowensis]